MADAQHHLSRAYIRMQSLPRPHRTTHYPLWDWAHYFSCHDKICAEKISREMVLCPRYIMYYDM